MSYVGPSFPVLLPNDVFEVVRCRQFTSILSLLRHNKSKTPCFGIRQRANDLIQSVFPPWTSFHRDAKINPHWPSSNRHKVVKSLETFAMRANSVFSFSCFETTPHSTVWNVLSLQTYYDGRGFFFLVVDVRVMLILHTINVITLRVCADWNLGVNLNAASSTPVSAPSASIGFLLRSKLWLGQDESQ